VAEDDLDRIARAGREAAAKSEAKAVHAVVEERDEAMREKRKEAFERALLASSFWARICTGPLALRFISLFGCWVPFFFLMVIASAAASNELRPAVDDAAPWFLLGSFLAVLTVFIVAIPAARAALRREGEWARGLPFALPQHDRLLSAPKIGSDLVMRIRFEGDAPESTLVRDVLSGDGGRWTVKRDGDDTRAERSDPWQSDGDHNRATVKWLHDTVDARLMALHARHPIASITIDCDDPLR
jgi:hypothetical protein